MSKIRVLVCDDMIYMCMFFSTLINSTETCECVGEAHNEQEVIQRVKELSPDIILLDVQMDSVDSGINLVPKILEEKPEAKIIMISVSEDNDKIFRSIRAGAKDYILKNQPPDDVIESIERVYYGKTELRAEISQKILAQCDVLEERQKSILYIVNKMMCLSSREMEVLRAACLGMSYEEISQNLHVEEVTVRTYISRILKKMQYSRMSTLIEHLNSMGIFRLFNNNSDN